MWGFGGVVGGLEGWEGVCSCAVWGEKMGEGEGRSEGSHRSKENSLLLSMMYTQNQCTDAGPVT